MILYEATYIQYTTTTIINSIHNAIIFIIPAVYFVEFYSIFNICILIQQIPP